MAKLIYKPFGIAFGLLGGLLAKLVFRRVWAVVSNEREPPEPTREGRSWGEVLSAAIAQGAIFALVKAAVDRSGAKAFQRLTGVWPGKERE
jgi:Protein of unknown function (DUF4235)